MGVDYRHGVLTPQETQEAEARERRRQNAILKAQGGNAPIGCELPASGPKTRRAYMPKAGPRSGDIRTAYIEALSELHADATLQEVCDLVAKRLRVTHKEIRNATIALRLNQPEYRRDTAKERRDKLRVTVIAEVQAILNAHPQATAKAKMDLYARTARKYALAVETVRGWVNGWTTKTERKRRDRV